MIDDDNSFVSSLISRLHSNLCRRTQKFHFVVVAVVVVVATNEWDNEFYFNVSNENIVVDKSFSVFVEREIEREKKEKVITDYNRYLIIVNKRTHTPTHPHTRAVRVNTKNDRSSVRINHLIVRECCEQATDTKTLRTKRGI